MPEPMPRLLIVDDDADLRVLLKDFFVRHGYVADTARDGAAMRAALGKGRYDLIVLDVMLPGDDGLALCRELRTTCATPIVFLTALADEADRIVGLELGADDYVVKPFAARELLARVRAILRRANPLAPVHRPAGQEPSAARDRALEELLVFAGWQLSPGRRELKAPDGSLVSLTAGELDLLVAFVRNPGLVLTRDRLLDLTKGRSAGPFDRSVDVQLSRLRRKLEADPQNPQLIKTVRHGGYLFAVNVERADATP
jgi:two-component system, OmpR family, response regulator